MANAEVIERRSPAQRVKGPRISWNKIDLQPRILLKTGISRQNIPLVSLPVQERMSVMFTAESIRLQGNWTNIPDFGSRLNLKLTNTGDESIRIARLILPIEAGVNAFVSFVDMNRISFFRNGYQSWSTARSYLPRDKPLRPWLQTISIVSSNLSNLPSNVPGLFSSEMYTIISDRKTGDSFLIGQDAPFNQFFYIRLNLFKKGKKKSYFELTYDFGRKMILPGQTIELSGIVIARGSTHVLMHQYFREINRSGTPRIPKESPRGWSSWYYYYTKITPERIIRNIEALKNARDTQGSEIDLVQVDDGYQTAVGDWLSLKPSFEGRMRELSDTIREAGFRPGIWIAPFIAARKSSLAVNHPEYLLKDERGHRLLAGFNPAWKGMHTYGLDITHPRFEEYLRKVIRTIVGDWGFTYLKCDFLYGGCLRGGTHNDLTYSRAEVLRYGMQIIREEAQKAAGGEEIFIVGCGMPLPTGIGTVDAMRIGPDTGGFWIENKGKIFRTGALMGVRNSLRNSLARSPMHRALWLNDPDAIILRRKGSRLSATQRRSQINAIALTGGLLSYSDDFAELNEEILSEIRTIQAISRACSVGRIIPWDIMDRELPTVVYNTAGYLGVFNLSGQKSLSVIVPFGSIFEDAPVIAKMWNQHRQSVTKMEEVWSGARIEIDGSFTEIGPLDRYESRLYRLE